MDILTTVCDSGIANTPNVAAERDGQYLVEQWIAVPTEMFGGPLYRIPTTICSVRLRVVLYSATRTPLHAACCVLTVKEMP